MTTEVSILDELKARFANALKLEQAMRLKAQVEERDSVFYLVVDYNQVPATAHFDLEPGQPYLVAFIRPFLPTEFRSIEPVYNTDLKTMTYCLGTVFDILTKR